MSFGVMGGATQPQGHAQIVMNIVDFKMNLQEAGDAPRISASRIFPADGGGYGGRRRGLTGNRI